MLVEIESVINCRPLTFVYDDQEGVSFALTPSHLIYGRRITSAPNPTHFEIMSTHLTLNRRVQHHRRLLEQFTKCWQRDYLLSLREHSTSKQRSTGQRVKVGDVVLLYDEGTKRAFWKLALVNELLPGEDGHARAAVIRVGSEQGPAKLLKRSIRHLIPIEASTESDDETSTPDQSCMHEGDQPEEEAPSQEYDHQVTSSSLSPRPRRQAAIDGEALRRRWTDTKNL